MYGVLTQKTNKITPTKLPTPQKLFFISHGIIGNSSVLKAAVQIYVCACVYIHAYTVVFNSLYTTADPVAMEA